MDGSYLMQNLLLIHLGVDPVAMVIIITTCATHILRVKDHDKGILLLIPVRQNLGGL